MTSQEGVGFRVKGRGVLSTVLFASGLLVALGLAGAVGLTRSSQAKGLSAETAASDPPAGTNAVAGLPHSPPLAGGVEVSLSKAESMTNLRGLLPWTSLASDASISAVWARDASEEAADMLVFYESGVAVEVRPWTSITETADQHWKALVSVNGLDGSIVNVNGQDMFVLPPALGGTGSVNFVTSDNTWVSIYGNGSYTVSQLLALATSAAARS